MAKDAFNKRRELLTKRMIKSLVWRVALYSSETWTMTKEVRDKLEAFEMWLWRRMEKISWKDLKTNNEVLHLVEEERNIVITRKKRKKKLDWPHYKREQFAETCARRKNGG